MRRFSWRGAQAGHRPHGPGRMGSLSWPLLPLPLCVKNDPGSGGAKKKVPEFGAKKFRRNHRGYGTGSLGTNKWQPEIS